MISKGNMKLGVAAKKTALDGAGPLPFTFNVYKGDSPQIFYYMHYFVFNCLDIPPLEQQKKDIVDMQRKWTGDYRVKQLHKKDLVDMELPFPLRVKRQKPVIVQPESEEFLKKYGRDYTGIVFSNDTLKLCTFGKPSESELPYLILDEDQVPDAIVDGNYRADMRITVPGRFWNEFSANNTKMFNWYGYDLIVFSVTLREYLGPVRFEDVSSVTVSKIHYNFFDMSGVYGKLPGRVKDMVKDFRETFQI